MGSVFGYEVISEIPLQRLRDDHGPRGTVRVVVAKREDLDETVTVTAIDHRVLGSGLPSTFIIGHTEVRTICGCSHTGMFRLDPTEMTISVAPVGDHEMWEHRLLSVIVPILLACSGQVALHGAAVELGGGAVVFCGPPMRGKSTLAHAFSELGERVLSEDGVVLERTEAGWVAWPAARGVRLRSEDEGRKAKVLSTLPGPEPRATRMAALVVLAERGGEPAPVELSASDALLKTAPHLMHAGGVRGVSPAFSALARVLHDVRAFEVSLADDLAQLPSAATDLATALANKLAAEA